jgi:enamine deaminase RidA (YjgF/YER057c/UK114 family)
VSVGFRWVPYRVGMTIELRNSDRLPAPAGFSHAAIASPGRVVHFAGQIGTDANGAHPSGLAAQTEQALTNVVDAVEGIGASVADIAKLTMYVVGWRESMQRELFTGIGASSKRTAMALVPITLVGVQSLFLDESLIEIEAVAVIDE